MNTNPQAEQKKHTVSMISRGKLDIDGVIDIIEFDNNIVNIKTNMGLLSVEGENLRIISMSREGGQIFIEGSIDSLFYYDVSSEKKSSIFKRHSR